ncbi:hypothetical protein MTO96_023551 [Rhipicephalus appendiculatus]
MQVICFVVGLVASRESQRLGLKVPCIRRNGRRDCKRCRRQRSPSISSTVPSLEDVAKVLNDGLKSTFEHVEVSVVDCPDLKEKPFMLASEGICGKPCLADVGGVPYLVPIVQKDKTFLTHLVIGAGAGPFNVVGVNSEMMHNMKYGDKPFNNSHYAKINEDGSYELGRFTTSCCEFGLMANLMISEGKPGKVIRVSAKKRTGKAKLHVMPKFSTAPLLTNEAMNSWLKFFEMEAPLVCLSVFVSHDPGWDLRIEHTHCFSDHKQGGHYHYDTTPEEGRIFGLL